MNAPRRRRGMSALVLGLVLALASAPAPAIAGAAPGPAAPARSDDAAELDALLARLARDPVRVRRFVERRHSTLYRAPEESRGTLRFEPPATFEKRTESPVREVLRIDGERLTVQRGDAPPVVTTIDAHPALRALVLSLRAALGGGVAPLRTVARLELHRGPSGWRVDVRPVEPAAAAAIERIELHGAGSRLERVDVLERGGDRSELYLLPGDGGR